MLSPDELRATVEAHLAATNTPRSVFGMKAVGDPNFVRDLLEGGREPRSRVVQKVVEFMERERAQAAA